MECRARHCASSQKTETLEDNRSFQSLLLIAKTVDCMAGEGYDWSLQREICRDQEVK